MTCHFFKGRQYINYNNKNHFAYIMSKHVYVTGVALMFVCMALSGCIFSNSNETKSNNSDNEWWNTTIHERENMYLNMSGWRSQLPVEGLYSWSGPTEHFVEV